MTPWTIQSLKFSRPEYWSGLPCPSPEDLPNPGIEPRSPALQADALPAEPQEKPQNTEMASLSLLQRIFPIQGSNPGLPQCRQILYQMSHKGSPRILEWVAFPFSRKPSQPRDRTQVPSLQVDSLPAEPQGKPKNTGVGSLSLLQGIFLTQESNWGLQHCRWILYQLSYQGSPY